MRWIEWHVDLVEEDWITALTELLVSRRREAKSWRSAKKRECGGKKIRLLLNPGIFLHFSFRLFYDFVPKISHF